MNSNSRYESSVDELRARTIYIVLTAGFGLWLVWDAAVYQLVLYAPYADYWEHTALLTEWLRNFSNPGNPHVDDPSLSSRYMPWFWVLTYIGVFLKLDAVQLMAISAIVSYLLIVAGLHLFLKNYFRDHWAPLIGFIAIFFFWGVSWNWSNLYHLRSFFYVAGYPSSFVFGISLLSFALMLRLLRGDGSIIVMGTLLFASSALMFLVHPLTAVFGIVGCGLLALTEPAESFRIRALALVALLAGMLVAELWPYFSVWKVALGLYGAGDEQWFAAGETLGPLERLRSGVWKHIFYDPKLVLTILGPALLGLPLCLWMLARRVYLFVPFGAAVMAVPYVLHPLVEVPLAHRFLLFVVTFFHFAIVWGVLQVFDAWNSRPRPAHAGRWLAATVTVMAVLVVFNIALLSFEYSGRTLTPKTLTLVNKGGRMPQGMSVVELYEKLTDPLPDDAVVLTTPVDGWPLPTVKGKVVSVYHENPLLLDQGARYADTMQFFEAIQDESQRARVVQQYGADHLLLKGEPATPGLRLWIAAHGQLVARVDDFGMYRLKESAVAAAPELPAADAPAAEQPAAEPVEEGVSEVAETAAQPEVAAEPVVLPADPEPLPDKITARPPRPQTETPPAAPESAAAEPPAGSYGAPITDPLIPRPTGVPPGEPLPEALSEPAVVPVAPVAQPAPVTSEPEVYGAPIAEPVLDPERHGG